MFLSSQSKSSVGWGKQFKLNYKFDYVVSFFLCASTVVLTSPLVTTNLSGTQNTIKDMQRSHENAGFVSLLNSLHSGPHCECSRWHVLWLPFWALVIKIPPQKNKPSSLISLRAFMHACVFACSHRWARHWMWSPKISNGRDREASAWFWFPPGCHFTAFPQRSEAPGQAAPGPSKPPARPEKSQRTKEKWSGTPRVRG